MRFLSLFSPLLLLSASLALAGPPNIVLILSDDHGWPDYGFMGHPLVQTPTLDELASQSVVFAQGQMSDSVCRTSSQTLLSGLTPKQWLAKRKALVQELGPIPLRGEVVHYRTLPGELRRLGYRSWQGGKHWEGAFFDADYTHGLATEAANSLFGSVGGAFGRDDWDPERCGPDAASTAPCRALAPLQEFLDDEQAQGAPFFLWFSPTLPHVPFDPPVEYQRPYVDLDLPNSERLYYAQITRMDALIGELLAELDARALLEETIVVYLADNGWHSEDEIFLLGRGKRSLFDLGARTPILIRWPERFPARAVDGVVSGEDLFATLLDLAGAEALPDRDGMSLRKVLEDGDTVEREEHFRSTQSFSGRVTGLSLRSLDWHYFQDKEGEEHLYRVRSDPLERENLASSEPFFVGVFRFFSNAWSAAVERAPERLEISGRIVDAAGESIEGATLILSGPDTRLRARTGRDGRYRFPDLAHGTYRLRGVRGARFLRLPAQAGEVRLRIPVGPTGRHSPELRARRSSAVQPVGFASIEGHLYAGGEPVVAAAVVLRAVRGAPLVRARARTDASGRFLIENLPSGLYRVVAQSAPGYRRVRAQVEVLEGQRAQLVLAAPPRPGPTESDPQG